jgi:mannose-6-phosphate isomerase
MAISARELRAHLLEDLLPLWSRHGIDVETGAFYARLGPTLEPVREDPLRLLVQLRQIFVFSSAAVLGAPGALEHALRGLEFLRERFWDDRHGGLFLALTPAGEPFDRRKDTYAHAFVLLAMAACHRAAGEEEPLRLADRVLALLEEHLADEVHGGFAEGGDRDWSPLHGTRRQNPHMHLFEGLLALYEERPDDVYLTEAQRILELLATRWIDPEGGALREFHGPDWSPAEGEAGRVAEPGHHFEWVWLLHEFARLTDDAGAIRLADRLWEFGHRHGVDSEQGGVYDQISCSGELLRDTKRLWPQTEYVRALAVRAERQGDRDARRQLDAMLEHCRDHYIDPSHGGWREHLTCDLSPASELMNATSVYHVWGAFSEAADVLERESR